MGGVLTSRRWSARMLRFAGATALACVLAHALPLAASAQVLDAAGEMSRDGEMLLEADTIIYDNDRNTVTAAGAVQIDYDGTRLVADRVIYDRATSRLIAEGGVEMVDSDGNKVFSDRIDITDDFGDGFVNTLRLETAEKVYFGAESAERRGGAVTTFQRGVYTACEPCEDKPNRPPIWRVKAETIIWNGEAKTVRFERGRFEMFGLPIAYVPAFEIADPTVTRKSGFLIPAYRGSDELGYGGTIPYFLVTSDTTDITFYPTYFSKQGFLAEAEWRQAFNNGEYSIRIAGIDQRRPDAFERSHADSDETLRGMVGTKGRFEINPRWTFGWDVLVQSDKNFSRTYGIDGYKQLKQTSQVYLTGLNDRNYFDLRAYRFHVQESLRDFGRVTGAPTTARNSKQPWVLPSFDYSRTSDEPVAGGELTVRLNAQALHRGTPDHVRFRSATIPDELLPNSLVRGVEGQSGRLTAEAEWRRSLIAPGGLMLTPILHGRGDAIGLDVGTESDAAIRQMAIENGVDADIRSAYARYMATAGMEARWPVLFSTTSSTHVLEPMAQIFARPDAPYQDSLGIPNEDAQSLVFDASNLFERDKFSGYDRIEGGVRANLGVRYSGSFGRGWSANALFGQSFHLAGDNPYAATDLVHAGAFSGLETDRSDYVGSVGIGTPVGLSLNASARFDKDDLNVQRTTLAARYKADAVTLFGAYNRIEPQPLYGFSTVREEVRFSASVDVHEYWRVFGGGTYDFESDVLISRSIGFEYDDECFAFALSVTEKINRNNPDLKSRNFGFAISFRTIGDFGSDVSGSDLQTTSSTSSNSIFAR